MTARCESNGCIEAETVGDVTRVWDTARPEQVLEVPAASWAAHEAALRADVLKIVARALLAQAEAYDQKWNRRPRPLTATDWDVGYVAGMQRAAHDVANSIDRPELLAEVRDEEKGNGG